ncbi:hypothetical protein IWQ51_004170 [Labrenzia sp. EL_142]|nr:hypothetical protein [Labrenzia sp. EL_142]
MREVSGSAGCANDGIQMLWLLRWPTRTRGSFGPSWHGTKTTIRHAVLLSVEIIRKTDTNGRSARTIAATWLGMVKGSLPSLSEPDVWNGTAPADASGALRRKHAEIHRGSRQRNIGPLEEAGYTSAIAKLEPEQIRCCNQAGSIYVHTRLGILDPAGWGHPPCSDPRKLDRF